MDQYEVMTITPYAYGYTENGDLYIRTHTDWVSEVTYHNTIGANLVDFAFLNKDMLEGCMSQLFGIYLAAKQEGRDPPSIAAALYQKMEQLFGVNTYIALYLADYIDFLLSGNINKRLYTEFYGDDLKRVQEAAEEAKVSLSDATKFSLIAVFSRSFGRKIEQTEKALKMVWETKQTDGSTPLERYYQLDTDNLSFHEDWNSIFTTMLGEKDSEDHTIVTLTILMTMDDLLRYEMVQFLTQGSGYKFCKNCGKPFIPSGRSDAVYCGRIVPGERKTCKQIGAYRAEKEKVNAIPAWKIYRQAYQRLNKRVEMGYMDETAFAEWTREATERRNLCLGEKMSYKDFADWINSTSRQR